MREKLHVRFCEGLCQQWYILLTVAMKCMKVHGAKDRNTVTFLEGKHVENTGGLERHGNKTTRYKDIVQKTS